MIKKLGSIGLVIFAISCIQINVFAKTNYIKIPHPYFTIDSFNGVDAVYTNAYNADDDSVYSCAAYVKKYYAALYGVTVKNLWKEGPPVAVEEGNFFVETDEPAEGDIVFYPLSKNRSNHSAIVKSVSSNTVTLIEQNYKTGGMAAFERTISYPSNNFKIYRINKAPSMYHTGQELTEELLHSIGQVKDLGSNQRGEYTIFEINNGTTYQLTFTNANMDVFYLSGDSFRQGELFETVTSRQFIINSYKEAPTLQASMYTFNGLQSGY